MIHVKTYTMPANGGAVIRDAIFIIARLLHVDREGMAYNRTTSTSPGAREFYCGTLVVGIRPQLGNLKFENEPIEDEKVTVVYDIP